MGAAASRSEDKSPQQITVEFDVRGLTWHSRSTLEEVGPAQLWTALACRSMCTYQWRKSSNCRRRLVKP